MEKTKTFIDFDGVILNSNKLILAEREKNGNQTWDEFFSSFNWRELYSIASEIDESLTVLHELELRQADISILSKVHTLNEALAKVQYLRDQEIHFPILLVPPHIRKSQIYIPTKGEILVDDSEKNINDWENQGGTGILFSEDYEDDTSKKVKSLKFLLK